MHLIERVLLGLAVAALARGVLASWSRRLPATFGHIAAACALADVALGLAGLPVAAVVMLAVIAGIYAAAAWRLRRIARRRADGARSTGRAPSAASETKGAESWPPGR